jgi:hypothetical protein
MRTKDALRSTIFVMILFLLSFAILTQNQLSFQQQQQQSSSLTIANYSYLNGFTSTSYF